MTITVTAKMLEEKNPCSLMRFTNLFGDSVELTVENLKITYEYDLNVDWFFENFPELIKKLNRSDVININSEIAFYYAHRIDRGPSDDTRKVACEDSSDAYWYAKFADRCGRDDTRKAAYKEIYWRRRYDDYFGKEEV